MQLAKLAFIPAGNLGEITGDPGNAIDIFGVTVLTCFSKSPGRLTAVQTAGEFRRKSDLVIVGVPEGLDDNKNNQQLPR